MPLAALALEAVVALTESAQSGAVVWRRQIAARGGLVARVRKACVVIGALACLSAPGVARQARALAPCAIRKGPALDAMSRPWSNARRERRVRKEREKRKREREEQREKRRERERKETREREREERRETQG